MWPAGESPARSFTVLTPNHARIGGRLLPIREIIPAPETAPARVRKHTKHPARQQLQTWRGIGAGDRLPLLQQVQRPEAQVRLVADVEVLVGRFEELLRRK